MGHFNALRQAKRLFFQQGYKKAHAFFHTTPKPRVPKKTPTPGLKRAEKTKNDIEAGAQNTVDGSEIRRSPVEVGSLSHYLQSFVHSQ